MPGLSGPTQLDFSAGMVRSVARNLIPPNGAYDIINGLLDDDGSVYRRGGCEYQSGAAFGTSLRFIWDGFLGPGQRTLIASATKFGVLDADDSTVVDLGGSGLATPVRAEEIGGLLFIGGGVVYGGSRKAADYSTGTVSVTSGSATVTGSGFTANVDAGMLLRVAGAGRYYVVQSVDSNTQLTLSDAYAGATAAGQAYALTRLGVTGGGTALTTSIYFVAAKRLFACSGPLAYFSVYGNPHTFNVATGDFHRIPGGAQIIGGAGLKDVGLIFASNGLWALTNLSFDLTDALGNVQQRLDQINRDLILWNHEGLATWQNAVVAPCTSGVWLVSPSDPPQLLSRSITPLYLGYLRAGYHCGQAAVYKNHYFLPILDSSNAVVDLLVARLDRPTDAGGLGTVFPWTRFTGQAGNVTGLAVRTNASPRLPGLLAADRGSTARVLKVGTCFEPQASRKNDADATTHKWKVVTRDYSTGPLNANFVKKLRVRYELVDAATDLPTIEAYYSVGVIQTSTNVWGTAAWGAGAWTDSASADAVLMSGSAPADDGRHPYVWHLSKKNRFIRFTLTCERPAASLALRWLEVFIRASGRM